MTPRAPGITVMLSSRPPKSQDSGNAASAKLGESAQKVLIDIFPQKTRKTVIAIANAFFNATGKRLNDLPFSPNRVKALLT